MAQVVRFRTPQQQADQAALLAAAEALRALAPEHLAQLPGTARLAVSRAIHELHRSARDTTPGATWPGGFVMLSRNQTKAVWDAIRALPAEDRPNQVRHAFDVVMLNIRQDTGEVMLTRDEIAAELGTQPSNVSRVMSTLERLGIIFRDRTRVEGMRGRGVVTYRINPHVAWNGSLDVRREEAAHTAPPLLTLMQGGASPDPE